MRGTLKEADYCTEMPFTLMRGTLKEADYKESDLYVW
jgi:hypothetical protein